jgi:hypothetical protein
LYFFNRRIEAAQDFESQVESNLNYLKTLIAEECERDRRIMEELGYGTPNNPVSEEIGKLKRPLPYSSPCSSSSPPVPCFLLFFPSSCSSFLLLFLFLFLPVPSLLLLINLPFF